MSPDLLILGVTWFVVFIFSTTLHEAGHAWASAPYDSDVIRQPMFSLIGLLAAWRVFPQISSPLQTLALNLLYPGAGYH